MSKRSFRDMNSLRASVLRDTLEPRKSPGIGYTSKVHIREKYHIVGFISSGTYGRVYKAIGRNSQKREFAIKNNWVLHRDLKPANILVTSTGAVRIGDLGLARLFYKPLNSLFSGDKVVVTIWYRAPELLLGSRHYTPAIDLWAFQNLVLARGGSHVNKPSNLGSLGIMACANAAGYPSSPSGSPGREGFDLLSRLLEYDPEKRLTAEEALKHPYFSIGSPVTANCFEGFEGKYPNRRVSQDDNDIRTSSLPGTKKSGLPDDTLASRAAKRHKEG
ncbi:serine/threonine-protein kinase prk1 [Histoplasma mississippiense (nom. inval.)]|uniref:serine/threonine-protein kinase prk1 n=1 Tax=Ajellomyces capsulatus (strain NAm1 / WU24) TaxID=2059318 RepID=UPI000157B7FA|nr:serine/threonine-protein kinase prk1 [Histoplasma mississippiense (nom. inval.)]EDN03245.1 serine/threonine-protein kinase prk1 [Histoplasma mississippiense (nom. inval.)]